MPKIELNDLVLGVSPVTETVYAGVLDKRAKGMWLHKKDIDSAILRCVVEKVGAGNILSVGVSDGTTYEIEVRQVKSRARDRKGGEAGPEGTDTPEEPGSAQQNAPK